MLSSAAVASGRQPITVNCGDNPLYTMVPERPPPAPAPADPPSGSLGVSRFALLRRVGNRLVLESPRSWCTVEIHEPAVAAAIAGIITGGGTVALPPGAVARLHRDLWWAGMLDTAPGAGEREPPSALWSAHEAWFHERSRVDRRDLGYGHGGTWWARGRFPWLPARREPYRGAVVELSRPDLQARRRTDPPFVSVVEARRTVRGHDDDAPMCAAQLGEFLYRCCRNRALATDTHGVEYVCRPYPSGGMVHELEVYPVIRQVAGLEPGMYHYDPTQHRLTTVCAAGAEVDRLLAATVRSADLVGPPQVDLVIAARFGRVMWKYEAMAYSLTLTHVGVLYQLMYTVATAMRLAPCALGGGDQDAFRAATGLDPLAEDMVGEFLLGSRPPAERGPR